MSYILEALKKSEQERRKSDVPGLSSWHEEQAFAEETTSIPTWAIILVVSLIVVLALGLVVRPIISDYMRLRTERDVATELARREAEDQANAVNETSSAGSQVAEAPNVNGQQPTQANNANLMASQQPTGDIIRPSGWTTGNTSVPQNAQNTSQNSNDYGANGGGYASDEYAGQYDGNAKGAALPIGEIPTYLQERMPAMSFSSHIYSSNPKDRKVMINGRMLGEGSPIAQGALLDEITEQGVIVAVDGQRVAINVMSGWDF